MCVHVRVRVRVKGDPAAFCSAAYSCHGRWFDAEGTQFVIATQLAPSTAWTSENNRPQPYRNSRRLCFMYKESGGVVSLTASEVACQRGIPPPPPMLAFNATSTGEHLYSTPLDHFAARSTFASASLPVAFLELESLRQWFLTRRLPREFLAAARRVDLFFRGRDNSCSGFSRYTIAGWNIFMRWRYCIVSG